VLSTDSHSQQVASLFSDFPKRPEPTTHNRTHLITSVWQRIHNSYISSVFKSE